MMYYHMMHLATKTVDNICDFLYVAKGERSMYSNLQKFIKQIPFHQ